MMNVFSRFLWLGLVVAGGLLAVPDVSAQAPRTAPLLRNAAEIQDLLAAPGILRNGVSNLHAEGDTLWVGPFLNVTDTGGQTWQVADSDSLFGSRNRVFSIDVEGDVIWAGLGYTGRDDESAAGGFLVSTDGGETFAYRRPQLDTPGDTTITYGINTLYALDVIVNEQSPPFDIDYDPLTGEVWTAAFASGIRVSRDSGASWERVVLPPDGRTSIQPQDTLDLRLEPRRGSNGQFNYIGFSVLVDETGTVWTGSSAGVNRSRPEDIDPLSGDRGWQRFVHTGLPDGLVGNWTVSIEEQPLPGRNPVWFANWAANLNAGETQRFGVSVTRDGGATFEQALVDVETVDFAFEGERVYVAARQDGLFISDDGGRSWRSVRSFIDASQPGRILRPNVDVLAVATTEDALWVGTSDGLLRSTDGGATWRLFRAEVPLDPDEPTDRVPEVETYAYPNPFSAAASDFVRIRYEVPPSGSVDLRIYDFSMNLVRHLVNESQPPGEREAIWDGTDRQGLRVANGPYFYAVETNGRTVWGKILVVE